ncbi:hypothetical protein QE424_002466 [Stenotrophomonas rhizophila]|uniref:Uncharacterized protein n=1 Tax=Stenotrophomonas rhizophila TaxID=216778 RepID=A0AAP5EAI7_9GAMM|nr:hypothetical protein [Stenotrophomonas rhizophila]MDQ1109307.1 hypothetical protein [Stenotrophomonas rhizophila]UQY88819.1 hypothetical protein LQE85_06275 [Stenotrophomonas rhizophila]
MAFDWTQLLLANTPWRIQVVADILPILIRRAKEGRPIFYGELAEQLEHEFGHEPKARKTVYGPPVGAAGQAIEQLGRRPEWRGERIPPMNTIVVSKGTGYPSTGADEIAYYFFEDNGAGMAADDSGKQRLAVEVKTSTCSEDDLMRGVYQCVKYRAILRAEQLATRRVPNGDAVLICPRAPRKITKALIQRLNVNFRRVPVAAEH